jgi:hypothetical protein
MDVHQPCHPVAQHVMAGDLDGVRIDVTGEHKAAQQLGGGYSQDAGAGSDVHGPADRILPRQVLESHQAAARRRMLTSAECGRRIERDADQSRWDRAGVMRAIDEKPPDPLRRESELVLGHPVAHWQPCLADLDERAPGFGGGESELGG